MARADWSRRDNRRTFRSSSTADSSSRREAVRRYTRSLQGRPGNGKRSSTTRRPANSSGASTQRRRRSFRRLSSAPICTIWDSEMTMPATPRARAQRGGRRLVSDSSAGTQASIMTSSRYSRSGHSGRATFSHGRWLRRRATRWKVYRGVPAWACKRTWRAATQKRAAQATSGRPSDGSSPSHAARSTDRRQRHPMALHDQGRHLRARRESRAPSGRRSPLRGDECGCVRAVGNRSTSGLDLVLQPLLYRSLRPRCQGRRRGLRWLVGVVAVVTEGTRAESAWAPLSRPVFRALWIASLVSNIGTWMQNVGAAWAMTSLSPSPLMVALVQSATSLPVFLVGLPAGAVADIVDRRRLLLVTQTWMLAAAALMAVLTFVGLMTATTLLALTFALGVGVAMNAPTWQAITSELVPPSELTRAVTLNALPVNIGRAIGPALGGILVAAAGPALVFALNAVSFVAVLVVVYRWRREAPRALLPAERVIGATRAGIRYARHAPPLVAVLVRLGFFIVCASAFWALLPVVAHRSEDHTS